MPMDDPFTELKAKQRDGWRNFGPVEVHTARPAAQLVRLAGIAKGDHVLDVACGTGPTTIAAARLGAKVTGLDLTPELLAQGKHNAAIAGTDDITWREGDVENLPYRDGEFDVVISQFGHMFAPRPDVTIAEMLRVLKPGGRLAFHTWPPESAPGQIFALVGRYAPPPPGVAPVTGWGTPETVKQRLGDRVKDLHFERGALEWNTVSPQHYRHHMEETSAPIRKVLADLKDDAAKTAAFRQEIDRIAVRYFRDNHLRMEYLATRAVKV